MDQLPSGHDGAGQVAQALDGLRRLLDAVPSRERRLPPERELARLLALSRGAVRSALQVLEDEGRISRIQGKGTFIGAPPARAVRDIEVLQGRTNPMEVMEARRELEPILARLAALRCTRDDIQAMRRFGLRASEAADAEAREAWDSALHRRLAKASGNAVLLALFDVVDRVRQDPTWRSLRERVRSRDRIALYVEQHERIIAAIADRDAPAAETAMRDHLEHVAASLASAMAGGAPAGGADGRDAIR